MHGRYFWIAAAMLVAVAGACATRDAFQLMHPPAQPEADFPGGYRLLPKAPIADWSVVRRFPDRDACEKAKRAAAKDAVEKAQERSGDQAKYDLDLRRAVHARCVPVTAER
jgi:hypothetical protein